MQSYPNTDKKKVLPKTGELFYENKLSLTNQSHVSDEIMLYTIEVSQVDVVNINAYRSVFAIA